MFGGLITLKVFSRMLVVLCVGLCRGLFKYTAKEIPAGSSVMIQRELCRRMSGLGWDTGGSKKEFL